MEKQYAPECIHIKACRRHSKIVKDKTGQDVDRYCSYKCGAYCNDINDFKDQENSKDAILNEAKNKTTENFEDNVLNKPVEIRPYHDVLHQQLDKLLNLKHIKSERIDGDTHEVYSSPVFILATSKTPFTLHRWLNARGVPLSSIVREDGNEVVCHCTEREVTCHYIEREVGWHYREHEYDLILYGMYDTRF